MTTPASDVYAVGATLYLLLTGREPPYRDDHNDKTIRLPTEESQTLPRELEEIVIRAMCYYPAERYPNAQAMLDEFRRLGYAPRPAAIAGPTVGRQMPPVAPPAPVEAVTSENPAPMTPSADDPSLQTLATITLPNLEAEVEIPPEFPVPPADLPINGLIKGRYNIREIISNRGGFGFTYWATDIKRNGRDVLLKLSKSVDAETFNSLLAEHKLLSELKHPRLPEVYENFSYKHDNKVLLGISMQYIRGRDMSSYLQDGPPDRPRAMQWVQQLLEVLAYLHKRDIRQHGHQRPDIAATARPCRGAARQHHIGHAPAPSTGTARHSAHLAANPARAARARACGPATWLPSRRVRAADQ